MVLLSGSGEEKRLVCAALPDRRVVDLASRPSSPSSRLGEIRSFSASTTTSSEWTCRSDDARKAVQQDRRTSPRSRLRVLAIAGTVFAMDWPLAPPRIAATFGTFAKGRVIAGIALSAEDGLVRAAEDGEVSFSLEERAVSLGPSHAPGLLHRHRASEGHGCASIRTLRPARDRQLVEVKTATYSGRPGSSGWIEGPASCSRSSTTAPAPGSIPCSSCLRWRSTSRRSYAPSPFRAPIRSTSSARRHPCRRARTGSRSTSSTSADSSWTVGPLAPYGIRLSIDGDEAANLVFDVAKGEGGKLMLFSGNPSRRGRAQDEGRTLFAHRASFHQGPFHHRGSRRGRGRQYALGLLVGPRGVGHRTRKDFLDCPRPSSRCEASLLRSAAASTFARMWDCGDFAFVRCRRCGLIQQNPQPESGGGGRALRRAWPTCDTKRRISTPIGTSSSSPLATSASTAAEPLFVARASAEGRKPRVLDVGCATGALLAALRDKGWEPRA